MSACLIHVPVSADEAAQLKLGEPEQALELILSELTQQGLSIIAVTYVPSPCGGGKYVVSYRSSPGSFAQVACLTAASLSLPARAVIHHHQEDKVHA